MQQLLPAQPPAGIFQEGLHHLIFHLGQLDADAIFSQLPLLLIQHKVAGGQHGFTAGCTGHTAIECLHTGGQLCQRKGLGHIIVRTAGKPPDLVAFSGQRGQHDDAHSGTFAAQLGANIKARAVRQHHIQQGDGHIGVLLRTSKCLRTGAAFQNLIPRLAEAHGHQLADAVFIFQDQYFFCHDLSPLPAVLQQMQSLSYLLLR